MQASLFMKLQQQIRLCLQECAWCSQPIMMACCCCYQCILPALAITSPQPKAVACALPTVAAVIALGQLALGAPEADKACC